MWRSQLNKHARVCCAESPYVQDLNHENMPNCPIKGNFIHVVTDPSDCRAPTPSTTNPIMHCSNCGAIASSLCSDWMVWKRALPGRWPRASLSSVLKPQIVHRAPRTLVVLTGGCFVWGGRCVQSGASIDHTKEQLFKGDWTQIESAS